MGTAIYAQNAVRWLMLNLLRLVKAAPNVICMTWKYAKVLRKRIAEIGWLPHVSFLALLVLFSLLVRIV